jgi:hypothetical protein
MTQEWVFEETNHAFSLEIWVEPSETQAHVKRWRARIVHIPSGNRKYVDNFKELVAFIAVYIS